jgi:hypothetical protein
MTIERLTPRSGIVPGGLTHRSMAIEGLAARLNVSMTLERAMRVSMAIERNALQLATLTVQPRRPVSRIGPPGTFQ